MESILLERSDKGVAVFAGRDAYLMGRSHGSQGTGLCECLEQRGKRLGNARPSDGVPWLTPILGSGLLDASRAAHLSPEMLASAAGRRLEMLGVADRDERSEEFDLSANDLQDLNEPNAVGNFVEALAADRMLRSAAADEGAVRPVEEVDVDDLGARAAAIAFYATRLYHLINAAAFEPTPLSREGSEIAGLNIREVEREGPESAVAILPSVRIVADALSWHARAAVDLLTRSGESGKCGLSSTAHASILNLLKRVGNPQPSRNRYLLRLDDVGLVTESAWYLLTRRVAYFPGWGDLLFYLALCDASVEFEHHAPRFTDVTQPVEIVRERLEGLTQGAWRDTDFNDRTVRTTHDRVADVLRAEQRLAERAGPGGGFPPPPASAFVSSLDLELERSLWRLTPVGEAFYMVLPVYLFDNDRRAVGGSDRAVDRDGPEDDDSRVPKRGKPVWLRAKVTKADGVDAWTAVTQPTEWSLLHHHTPADVLKEGPHVVRLAGSPMVRLPLDLDWADVVRRVGGGEENPVPLKAEASAKAIVHAMTLDEYLVSRHAEAELSFLLKSGNTGGGGSFNLPPHLRADAYRDNDSGPNPRFWLALGVAMADLAVRLRVISQITATTKDDAAEVLVQPGDAPSSGGLPAPPASAPKPSEGGAPVRGVVVDRRLSPDSVNLLLWAGFDVVRSDAEVFDQDLSHYVVHLEAVDPFDSWPGSKTRCELGRTQG